MRLLLELVEEDQDITDRNTEVIKICIQLFSVVYCGYALHEI